MITLNGSSGVTTPGISNSEGYTGDGLTIAAGAPSGAVQVDTSGNLGLGVTPSAWAGFKAFQTQRSTFTGFTVDTYVGHNWYWSGTADTYIANDYATRYQQTSGQHRWYTAPSGTAGNAISFTQAMTLDASGNLLVGTTSLSVPPGGWHPRLNIVGPNVAFLRSNSSGSVVTGFQVAQNGDLACGFYNTTPSLVGSIAVGSGSVAYNTSSDYRLKENIAPMTGALAKVAQLKPCTYTWKSDGSAGQGFIAHELQEVCPDAVTGEKDAVNEDGSIKPQGIDTSFLAGLYAAALQELKAQVDAQAVEIAALKGQA